MQQGRLLREPIERALQFYRGFFARYLDLSPAEVRRRAARFIEPTHRLSPSLLSEYEGIAEGSQQCLEDILALSGRYEITYEKVRLGECSNLFVGPLRSAHAHTLLGQNWEWRPEVLDFRAILVCRCDDIPDYISVTECGQPGKYGFNEHGLGVIETGLCCESKTSVGDNLFVAVTRGMLEQSTLQQARRIIYEHPPEATISFILADDQGSAVNFESLPGAVVERELDPSQIYWHTNHSLVGREACTFDDSLVRGERWQELLSGAQHASVTQVGQWLADRHNGYGSICKIPNPALADSATWLQTLCSIVMDLPARQMWVSDGPSSEQPYRRIGFDSASWEIPRFSAPVAG